MNGGADRRDAALIVAVAVAGLSRNQVRALIPEYVSIVEVTESGDCAYSDTIAIHRSPCLGMRHLAAVRNAISHCG